MKMTGTYQKRPSKTKDIKTHNKGVGGADSLFNQIPYSQVSDPQTGE